MISKCNSKFINEYNGLYCCLYHKNLDKKLLKNLIKTSCRPSRIEILEEINNKYFKNK